MHDDRERLIRVLNLTSSEASALPTYRNAAYGVCIQYLSEVFPHRRLALICRQPTALGVRSIVSLLLDEGPGAVIAALDRTMRQREEPS